MKKSFIILATGLLLIVVSLTFVAFRSPAFSSLKRQKNTITGTWQLESYKYGTAPSSFTSISPDRPHIKLITENSFLWVTYATGTKKILESAGGKYVLEGENYTESIDYGYNMDSYLGTYSTFKIKIEDGMMFISGTLSGGYKIEEIWQKVN